MRRAGAYAILLAASAVAAAVLAAIGLPAGLLLGPMIVAVVLAARGADLKVAPPLFVAAQAVIGLLIAPSLNLSTLAEAAREPGLFAGATLGTLAAGVAIGWLLARWQVLPGSVAIWGSMPGAATAMVLMARDKGADWQLVALMSFLRVICVALIASALAATMAAHAGVHAPGHAWFPPPHWRGLAETAAIGLVGATMARRVAASP